MNNAKQVVTSFKDLLEKHHRRFRLDAIIYPLPFGRNHLPPTPPSRSPPPYKLDCPGSALGSHRLPSTL